jgi:DNA-binding transcriptional ArsR family regulator
MVDVRMEPNKDIAANAVMSRMPVSLFFGSPGRESISARVSPLAELCACLHAFAEPHHHPASRRWVTAVRAELDEELLIRAGVWKPLWSAFRARYLLPLRSDAELTLDAELAAIARLHEPDFLAMSAQALIGMTSREPPQELMRGRFLPRLSLISEQRHELGRRLLDDVGRFRDDLLAFLATMAEAAFESEWSTLRPMLEIDARTRTHNVRKHGTSALADLPAAAETVDPPGIVFDKLYHATARLDETPCVLVPSLHITPHTVIKHYPRFPVVVQYPVSGDGAAPTLDAARHRLAALQDPMRIRLARALLREPMTTSELANRYEMTAPQTSRHLRRLREAGLVLAHRSGTRVRYQLDVEAVRRMGVDLLSALYR